MGGYNGDPNNNTTSFKKTRASMQSMQKTDEFEAKPKNAKEHATVVDVLREI